MLFWLAINAQLAFKRRPFEVQLIPFLYSALQLLDNRLVTKIKNNDYFNPT